MEEGTKVTMKVKGFESTATVVSVHPALFRAGDELKDGYFIRLDKPYGEFIILGVHETLITPTGGK